MALCSAWPRTARLLRWSAPVESSGFVLLRGFASIIDSPTSSEQQAWQDEEHAQPAGSGFSEHAHASSSPVVVADDLVGAAAGSNDAGLFIGSAMAAVDGLHSVSGLPWWATLSAVAVVVRAAMLPISLQGMRASAALMPLLRQARDEVTAEARPPAVAAAAGLPSQPPAQEPQPSITGSTGGITKQQRWQRAQRQAAATTPQLLPQQQQEQQGAAPQAPPQPRLPEVVRRFHQLRQQAGAPHPLWVLASPLAQLPVFITAMAAIRTMSLSSWPGFSTGGAAWFPDLTLPAMDLAGWAAPMGTAGVALPMAITLCMLANIDAAFPVPAGIRQQDSMTVWLLGGVRLVMEWMLVPLFAIALQLPQGALCYWATSSGLALVQNVALRQPGLRQAVGLPSRPPQRAATYGPPPGAGTDDAAMAAAVAAGASMPRPGGIDAELRQFLLATSDAPALLQRAAQLRAEGRAGAACTVLQRLLQLHPGQPNALLGLGQVHAALRDWALSQQHFQQAAYSQQLDAQSRARAWFGVGVALHMQQQHAAALAAFSQAAELAQTDALRVRSWVSQATLHRRLGQLQQAEQLLRRAARAHPDVHAAYLQPLLDQMAGQQGGEDPRPDAADGQRTEEQPPEPEQPRQQRPQQQRQPSLEELQ